LPIPANATLVTLFPDANLRMAMMEELGGNDAWLTGQALSDRLARVEKLNASSRRINDAAGIEYLLSLTMLDLRNNNLTILNLINLTNLVILFVSGNQLASLDVGNNIYLTTLSVGYNKLIHLDISRNIYLIFLDINYNRLTTIDIRNNVQLTGLQTDLAIENILGFYDNPQLQLFRPQ